MGKISQLLSSDEKKQRFYIEHEEFLALKVALPDHLKALVTIAYYTGMRKKEILDLKWDQIDFPKQMITVLPGKTVVVVASFL